MRTVEIAGRTVRLQANQVIGHGGEADVFRLDPATVLKLYKLPTDPDYSMDPLARHGAQLRLIERQHKLPAFPSGLPLEVVTPQELAYTGGKVAGFTMPFISGMEVLMQLGNRAWRDSSGIDANQVVQVFRVLHDVVGGVHHQGVVIGDFNDLNVMTDGKGVRIVDADSMQFGNYPCQTYTARFLDPLLASGGALTLARPHGEDSDWYAFFVMLIQSLLYVGPYGGVHRPSSGKRYQHDERVLRRHTFLGADVLYPKPALPFAILPDGLQSYFEAVTSKDERGVFPPDLLDNLRFTTCVQCGSFHARGSCPQCQTPGVVRETVTVRGQVTARQVFRTRGKILQAVTQRGTLHYLYEDGGVLYREGDNRLMQATLSPELRFRLQGPRTLIGHGTALLTVEADGAVTRRNVDTYRGKLPMFDTNSDGSFWLQSGQLMQSGVLSPAYLGDVLAQQTLLWSGEQVGFGFYQAGQMVRGFVFTPGRRGLNDQVAVNPIRGQLVDATCAISDDRVWFFTATQESGVLWHRVQVIDPRGVVLATAEAKAEDDSWLGRGIRGHLAVGHSLFAATDDGLKRLTTDNQQVVTEREFPDTEPFVSNNAWLLQGPGGIYVVSTSDITLLTIK